MDYKDATKKLVELKLSPYNWTNQVIVAEALLRDISVSKNKNDYIVLTGPKGNKFTWKSGYTNLNTLLAQKVAKFKDVFSRILIDQGAPATENSVFGRGDAARAWLWAESLRPLVVKPLDGMHGRDVYVNINSLDEFLVAFESVAKNSDGQVLVEKFYAGVEHRCYLVNHKLVAATRRRPASVVGDGQSTVRELVEQKNSQGRVRPFAKVHSQIVLDKDAIAIIAENGHTPDSIVANGVRLYTRKTSNIHAGGDAIDATDELSIEEVETIELASRAVPGGRVVGLDVLLPRNPGDDGIRILEMNTNSMISMHHFPWEGEPRNAAAAVLDAMFSETKK